MQSLAIIEWLEELQPDPPLLPADPLGRATVRSLALHVVSDIQPLTTLRVLQHLRHRLGTGEHELSAWQRHWIAEGLASLERRLARVAGTYCLWRHGHPGRSLPRAAGLQRAALSLRPPAVPDHSPGGCGLPEAPAFAEARPERQPDAA